MGAVEDTLLALYRTMLRIRLVEERIVALYAQQEMRCPTHFSIGQEAVAAGVCAPLAQDDLLFGTYRGHGLYLAKGGDLNALIAELYGKETGCTRGRGGSMQLVAPEVGLMCTSAMVGGTIPMAVGAAFSAILRGTGQVAVVVFGDGATEEGVFHESLNFAALKRLPVVFVCENNFYACYSPQGNRQPLDNIAERAAAYGIPGMRLDGNDALAVVEAVGAAVARARQGQGPSLIECRTYRWLEHVGPNDDTTLGYRTAEEVAAWKARCPLKRLETQLMTRGTLTASGRDTLVESITHEIDEAVAFAEASPFPRVEELAQGVYAVEEKPRRPAPSVGPTRQRSFCEAINDALHQAMEEDPAVIVLGEGVDDPRAIFGSTRGLKERFGNARVFDTPLSENGITGVAIGASLTGLRPVMTHQRFDFLLYAMDQLVNHAAKRSYSSGGRQSVPLTIRAVVGRGWGQGPQHSQSLQAWLAHVPGLKVVMPATPADAKGLLLAAIHDPNPVLCIEYRTLYDEVGEVPQAPVSVPLGEGVVRWEGTDVTVVAFSYMVVEALRAVSFLKDTGIAIEVLDPRTVKPLDEPLILRSVEKTGRLVVADTGWTTCGMSAEVVALVCERAFAALKAPVRRVALPDLPVPTSQVLERAFYPGAEAIAQAVCDVMGLGATVRPSGTTQPLGEPIFVGPF